jgi:hypothetical protein
MRLTAKTSSRLVDIQTYVLVAGLVFDHFYDMPTWAFLAFTLSNVAFAFGVMILRLSGSDLQQAGRT